ncbi:VCBS domain-containing protein [Vibrio splendidus]
MANKKNVETNKKNTEIKNKKSNELEQKKPTQKKKRRLHSHLKVNIPLFQSLMMILPSLAKHAAAESIDNASDAADQVTANNVTEKDVTDDHNKADSSAVALQEAQTSDNDVNSTLSASHAAHGSSSHLVPSHHLSTLSHPQVHYIPSVSMPTISSGSNGQPTHSNAPTTPALPVTFMPEVIKGTYGELHVDANGQYTFVLNPNSPQYILLNQHQPGTDHFALHLSNGSSIIVQIPITGKQDTPSISGDLTGVVTEDHNIDSQGLLHANGKIDVIDPDQKESSVTPEVISGKYGSLTIDADGHWQYQVDNSLSNVQALTAATSLHESFTIHTKDGTPQTIDMTIGGNDDNAVITGVDAGTLTEDLTTQVQGQLSVTDSDLGEDHFQASQVTSNFGTLSITKDGAWTYSLDNNNPVVQRLGQGSTATDIVTVHSADGTAHQVMVTINGTNDHAVITSSTANSPSSFFAIGTSNGSSQVTEDKDLTVSGQLNITDIDSKEAHFSNSDLKGTLGTLHLKDNGDWSYDLDNKNPKVQALGQGSATTDIITIHSADGTPHQIAITVNGTNDKAVISGTSAGVVTEESQLQTSGTLVVTDVDTGEAHFSNTDIVGSFGTLHLTDTGSWTYDLDNTNPNVQALGKGATATDTITVHSAGGTPHQVTITVNGTNDAATVSSATVAIDETDKAVTTSGTLTSTDVDNPDNTFTPDSLTGSNGDLTIDASGHWVFTANSAFNQLNVGDKVEETFTVTSVDGTPSTIKVTINGTNDAATVSSATVAIDETDKAVTTSGTLTSTDVDNTDNTFTPDSVVGSNGDLTIDANGHWTFTANSAFNQLNVGDKVEETFTVSSVDGTASTIKVTINGTNDKATVSTATVSVDETDKAVTTSGTLTSTDVDNPDNAFTPDSIAGTNGDLTIDGNGHWSFTANSAFNQLNVGDKVEETFTVSSVDGTTSTIKVTINGTNDKATVSSASIAIDETDKAITTSGTLTSNDVDNPDNTFTPVSLTGTHGGLTIDANGHWVFTAGSAFNQLNIGDKVEETFTVSSIDGTPSTIKVTINGTNDKATVSSATVAIDETDKAVTTSGTLTSIDVDNPDNAFTPDSITGTNGDLTIDANGHWVFTANSAFNQLNVGDKIEETFTVSSIDGTASTIKVTINGTNDKATVSSATVAIDETDKAVTTSGTLTSIDVDNPDNTFTPDSIAGTNGDLTVDANGHWVFTANSAFNQLNVGDKVEETFTVSSVDGTPSTIKVTINGTNDKATVSSATVAIDETDKAVTTSGTLTSTDVDNPDNTFTPDSISGTNGDLTIDANGHWIFTANSAFNQLNVGDKVEETFTVSSVDGTASTIKVTINGTNDAATVSTATVSVDETDKAVTTSGTLTSTDVDNPDNAFTPDSIRGTNGNLTIDTNGHWTFTANSAFNQLNVGDKVEETFTVSSVDGTASTIKVAINGTNDAATVSSASVAIDETDRAVTTSGTLTSIDVDNPDNAFTPDSISGTNGDLTIDANGHWVFTASSAFNQLNVGDKVEETFTVSSIDGTASTIKVTINGTNDKAVISGTSAGAVTEESQLQTSGSLTVTDVDAGQAHFSNTDIAGTLGTLHLTNSGTWTYDLDNTNPAVQALGNGATATDTITVHSADGTPHQVTIKVNGTNDNAVVGGVDTASVTEKAAGDNMSPDHAQSGMATLRVSTLNANGHLSVIDPDSGQSGFADNNVGYNYHGTYGDLILNPNGDWDYYADAGSLSHIGGRPTTRGSAIDKLGEGETLTDTITVHTKDGTPHNIVITINGSNDRPYCSSEVQLNAGTEDTRQTITAAQLLQNSIDVDKNDSGLLTVANLHPDHGSILDNQNGTYTFTPEKDYNGKVHFTYDVKDAHGGVTHTGATSSLSAVADKAVISGSDTGTIIEDHNVGHSSLQPVVASGLLSVTDPDAGQDHFQVNLLLGEQAIHDPFGGFLRITPSGAWGYEVANSRLQSLAEGEVEKVVYRVYSADHTAHDITITVTGTNDQPTITATTLAHGTEDTHYQMQSSQFGFNDIDTGDTLHSIAITDLPPATQGKFVLDGHDVTAGQQIPTADISKLQFVPAQDFNGDVQFKYTVNDGHTDSAEATNTLHIDAVGDKAVISGVDTGNVYENRNPDMSPDFAQSGMAHLTNSMIHVEGQLTIIDPDTGENSFDSKGIGYTYHGKYGHLILNTDGKWFYGVATGTADVNGGLTTNVGSTIDQLGANETLTDTITIQSKDGTTHDIVITIHGDNDRPYCSSEVQLNSGKEDLAQTITATELLANTIDVDSNDLGKLTVANLHADHGSILDNQDGTYTFTPTKDYNGQINFSYDVTDAHGGTTHTGASTTLTATPDGAIISEVTTDHVTEDGSHSSHNAGVTTELANGRLQVVDPDSGENKFQYSQFGESAVHDPFGGMLRIDSMGNWGYSVNNANLQHLAQGQTETVIYRVHSYDGTAYELHIDVVGTNDAPTVTQVALSNGTEDTPYQMQASQFGFTDVDSGDTLHSVAITDLPPATQGKFVLDGHDVTAGQHIPTADISKLQFVPAQDFNGDVQFKYTVNDGHTDSAEATNTLHIDAVGDKAVISGVDTGDVHEGHTFTAPDGSMTGGYVDDRSPDHMHGNIGKLWNDEIHTDGHLSIVDADAGESYAQTGVYYGSHGRVILQTNGDWSYFASIGQDVTGRAIDHLRKGESLTDTVTVKSADGTTHDIIITIHGDNDRPYCSGEVQLNSGKEDLAQTITASELLANTVDVDTNDAGQLTIANLHADHGTLVDNKDGTFTFTPDHDFNGKVHFTYDVKDAHGGVTHTGASATLLPSNDAATLQPTLASNFVTEDHLKSGTNTNELWSGWKNLDIQDIDSQPEAKVTQIEVNGVKHTVPANFAMNLAGTHGTFNFTHSTDGHDKWSYSADNSHAEVQSLSHGDSLTDTITLITADGTRIPLTAKILGTDDHVIIDTPDALTAALGTAVEDKVTSISGTLLAHDSDSKDSVTFTAGNSVGAYGTLHVDSNGQWHYDLDHSKANALQQGETKAEGFDITAISTDGSTATKHIEVLVQGNDDGAIISGQDSGQVTEDKHLQTSGNLTVTDPDSGEGHFTATSGSTQLGTYTIDASGHWTYSLDPRVQSLHQGETTPDVFTVHSADGTAHVIKVTITGTQDAPIITGQSTGAVYEDSQTSVSGTLNADDKDYGQSGFWAQSHIASTHNFGDLSIDRNGHWTFHLDPTNTAVNALGEHDTLLETVTVNTIDGTSKEIQITIHGTNDGAIISGGDTGSVTEDQFTGMQWLITKGQLTISDADTGEDKFDSMVHAQNNAGIGYDTKLGGHVLLSEDGSWQYNMDNFSPAVQKLAEGETAIDTVTIHSVDGTPHEIQITITGTNDAPILGVNQTSSTTGTLTETDVDVNDTHMFSVVSSTGQFGSLSVDPNTGDYVYTPNTSITGMSYNSATNSYHGVDVFEVKVSDGHTEDSKFITFDASGHVTMSPTGSLVTSTTVPHQPVVTATQPTLLSGTNVAPTNTVTLDLASTSDSGSWQTDNLTNDTTPTITGHTDIPFSKVTIYDGSTPVGHSVSDASGQYSVSVSSLSDGDHNLSAKALAPSSVMSATSSPLSVHIDTQVHVGIQTDPITADNVINAQESNSSIDITGSVSGDFNTGDIVTLDVNGTQHTGVVDAKGHYSIAVPGSELIADADQKIEASVAVTDTAGNSAHATADVTYQVDTQVSVPTITFENAGADNLYSKAEIARGQANTITATVTPPGDAKIGEHLVVNGQDHVLDAHTLQHGIQIEVHPGSNVQATMTDEHGNTAGSQGFAASAIPEPIIVRPPSGSHQVSGTLGIPPLLPSLTPVPTAQSGWRIHLPNGQYVTSHHGQYGTLTIDPQTGHLHYQEQAQVHTGPHGSASGIGQHEDKFEVALQGSNQDEVVAHVNIQILSHGPGHSGKLTVGTEVVDMTITPLVHTSHPAPPPPPPVQHDEPDMASQADFTVTLSDDSNLDLTQQTHQEPEQKTSHHGAAAYLDALGIKPDATSTTVHDQPADMDIVLAQVDQPDAATHDQAHLDMSDALEHHDANINHNQDDEHHHHNDIDGLPDIDPNS